MFSWEICPQSTLRMMVLNSQLLYNLHTIFRVTEVRDIFRQIIQAYVDSPWRSNSEGQGVRLWYMFDKIQRNTKNCKDFIKTEFSATGLSEKAGEFDFLQNRDDS